MSNNNLMIFTTCLCLATVFATKPYYHPVNITNLFGKVGKLQAPEAVVVEFGGLDKYQAETIRKTLVSYLETAQTNDELANSMWDYFRTQDPSFLHLVTISKCFDYCFEGNSPDHFVTIDIDRSNNRFMMVGRKQC